MKLKFRTQYAPRELRAQKVEELKKALSTAKSIVLFSTERVPHIEFETFRKKLASVGTHLHFVKNTLFRVAAREAKLNEALFEDAILQGSTAVLFIESEDFVMPIKIFKEAFGKNENVKIKIGFIDSTIYESGKVLAFASIPSKQELYTKLVGSMSSPLYGLYYALTSDLRKLAIGLHAISLKMS